MIAKNFVHEDEELRLDINNNSRAHEVLKQIWNDVELLFR